MNKIDTYPDSIEAKIGFDNVRRMVAELCLSTLGRAKVTDMAFSNDYDHIRCRLSETYEMMQIMSSGEDFPLNSVHDLTAQLKAMKVVGTHMAEGDLLKLRNSLSTINDIASFFKAHKSDEGVSRYPALDRLCEGVSSFSTIVREIDSVIDKFGYVKDSASSELSRIRSSLSSMNGAISSAMRRVIAAAVKAGYLDPDTTPSLRDGRPVIPVAPMNKRNIPGIVHDESASGKTFFIEPAEVVETSNRVRELQIEERREVMRILVDLASRLRPFLPEMLQGFAILADFDFIHAKARFAQESGGNMPHLHPDMQLEWYHACHPILKISLQNQHKEIVPLDITLTPSQRILVISGPNAGGKSVTLKTVAIVQYMAQCGLMPPLYDNSHMGVADGIFIDIGDDQSIEDDLSTYSSHLRNMKYFLSHGTARTLILIDEFGSGTEPQIGGALAQAMLAQFVEKGMWGVVTTHFHNLKHFADQTEGLVNGSMLYDRQLMQPLFRLSIGNAGSSFAIEIARKTGLPESIISEAESIVGSDYINLDKYLLDIARDKRYWENKRTSIRQKERKIDSLIEKYEDDAEQLRIRRREIIEDARRQAQEIIDGSNAAVERTIHDIKEANAEKQRTLEARRALQADRQSILNTAATDHPMLKKKRSKRPDKPRSSGDSINNDRPFEVGDNVLLEGSQTVGKILEISGKDALVAFGMLKTKVKLSKLSHTLKKVSSGASKAVTLISSTDGDALRDRQLNFRQEIDVRGMRVDEAVQTIAYFIDDAVQFCASRVRILHGTGTGALRQSIRDYLSTVPAVISFADEDVRFGGAGITVVNLA